MQNMLSERSYEWKLQPVSLWLIISWIFALSNAVAPNVRAHRPVLQEATTLRRIASGTSALSCLRIMCHSSHRISFVHGDVCEIARSKLLGNRSELNHEVVL